MKNGGCLVVLSLAYSVQDERDGNQSGAPKRGGCEPSTNGEGIFGSVNPFFLVQMGLYGRMVERYGGKVEYDGFEYQKR
jgi:hypothetical protein